MIIAMLTVLHQIRGLPADSDGDSNSSSGASTSGGGGVTTGTNQVSNPGSLKHRMIGVIIVVALALLIFILWLLFAKWPRRKLRRWGCTCLPAPPDSDRPKDIDLEAQKKEGHDGDDRPQSWVMDISQRMATPHSNQTSVKDSPLWSIDDTGQKE